MSRPCTGKPLSQLRTRGEIKTPHNEPAAALTFFERKEDKVKPEAKSVIVERGGHIFVTKTIQKQAEIIHASMMRIFKRRKPTDRQLTDEEACEHGKEVSHVEGHDCQHPVANRKSQQCTGWQRPNLRSGKTYSKYPTPAWAVKMHARGRSVENRQGGRSKQRPALLTTFTRSSRPLLVKIASSLWDSPAFRNDAGSDDEEDESPPLICAPPRSLSSTDCSATKTYRRCVA